MGRGAGGSPGGDSGSVLLPTERDPRGDPGDAACPQLQATKVPCPGSSSHKSARTPCSSPQRGAVCPPCPPATAVPPQGRAGPGGGWRRCRAGSRGLARAEEDDGAAAEAGEPDPRGVLDGGRQWQCPWRGTDPTIAAVEPGCPGAHRILTRRPSVSATFTRTAGTGSFRSRFRAGRSGAETFRAGGGGVCGATVTHPFPRPGPCPGPSRIPALLHHPRKVGDAGPLCQPPPLFQPHQRSRGGTGTPVPLCPPPPRTPQLCSPGDGCHGSRMALLRLPALPGPGAVGPRGPWGTGLKLVGLLLHLPEGGKQPPAWGSGAGEGSEAPTGPCRRWPGQASPISTIS